MSLKISTSLGLALSSVLAILHTCMYFLTNNVRKGQLLLVSLVSCVINMITMVDPWGDYGIYPCPVRAVMITLSQILFYITAGLITERLACMSINMRVNIESEQVQKINCIRWTMYAQTSACVIAMIAIVITDEPGLDLLIRIPGCISMMILAIYMVKASIRTERFIREREPQIKASVNENGIITHAKNPEVDRVLERFNNIREKLRANLYVGLVLVLVVAFGHLAPIVFYINKIRTVESWCIFANAKGPFRYLLVLSASACNIYVVIYCWIPLSNWQRKMKDCCKALCRACDITNTQHGSAPVCGASFSGKIVISMASRNGAPSVLRRQLTTTSRLGPWTLHNRSPSSRFKAGASSLVFEAKSKNSRVSHTSSEESGGGGPSPLSKRANNQMFLNVSNLSSRKNPPIPESRDSVST